jgi:hypothetical protein
LTFAGFFAVRLGGFNLVGTLPLPEPTSTVPCLNFNLSRASKPRRVGAGAAPAEGRQRSSREIAAELARRGHLNEQGKPLGYQ